MGDCWVVSGALFKAFGELIKELWASDSSGPVNTAALKSQIQRFAPRFMGYSQQDAQEFLRYFLEGWHQSVKRYFCVFSKRGFFCRITRGRQ